MGYPVCELPVVYTSEASVFSCKVASAGCNQVSVAFSRTALKTLTWGDIASQCCLSVDASRPDGGFAMSGPVEKSTVPGSALSMSQSAVDVERE